MELDCYYVCTIVMYWSSAEKTKQELELKLSIGYTYMAYGYTHLKL